MAASPPDIKIIDVKSEFDVSSSPPTSPASAFPAKSSQLPQEVSAWRRVPAVVPIVSWIALSSGVIIMNKYILSDLGYSHPIALTTIHLFFQVGASRFLAWKTNLLDSAKELESTGVMNNETYVKKIVPIGVLFSLSLVLSNFVYLRLSLAFIQMIKAITPVVILLLSFAFGLRTISQKLLAIVCSICIGVVVASYGEIHWDTIGFSVQMIAIFIESTRLLLIQVLLQDAKMNPLVSLYYFAPVCLLCNLLVLFPIEGLEALQSAVPKIGFGFLCLNAASTFALNLASVWLIGAASGLVLTLSGVIKDIFLITLAWFMFSNDITNIQIFGYGIAVIGLVLYKTCA